jgi:predicted acylesterase/phospholipase RssA
MTIKHLVISGGGPILLQFLSAIQELENKNYLNTKEIETIYGTSAGALIGVMIALKFDWETLNDYIIKRPWQDVFPIKVQNILDAYTKKGIFDIKTVEKCFKPLLDAKDIPLDINLEDFYNITKIELHMITFEVNKFKVEDISYKTYPKLSLLKAVQMSCAIPILMSPVCINDKCFIDGGVACNYPLNFCIESGKSNDEILGFKNKYANDENFITESSSLLDYLLKFVFKAILSINEYYLQPTIKYEVICDTNYLNLDIMRSSLSNIEARKELFEKGKISAINFLNSLQDSI